MRPAELVSEPSASALPNVSRSTRLAAQRPITGPSIAETAPVASEIAKINGRPPTPVRATAASPAASTAWAPWAAISNGRAGSRSASTPPQTLSSSVGAAWSSTAKPMDVAEPVSFRTYQLTPRTCIQVPMTEMKPARAQIR
ncbi:hypothetical protein PSN01_04029 [Micromonospora saelicesensis]|nr:hypothetical protein PSN01_04029 [Micromonospora saelicesensis]